MIGLIATLKIKDGSQEAFEGIFTELSEAVRANESGNQLYQLFKTDDPVTYIVMEIYADADAVAAHGGSDHMRAIGGRMGEHMDGRPEIQRLTSV